MSDPTGSLVEKRRAPRWMWITLVVSLAANLLVLGAVVGMRLGGHDRGWRGGGYGFLRHLPRDRRAEIKAIVKKHREAVKPKRQELREARRLVGEVLAKDPLSTAELGQALDRMRDKQQAVREALRPMIFEVAGKLTPGERARFMKRLMGRHGRGRRHGG